MQASETTETTIPTVAPAPLITALQVPWSAISRATSLVLLVNVAGSGAVDMIRYKRDGDRFILEHPGSVGGE